VAAADIAEHLEAARHTAARKKLLLATIAGLILNATPSSEPRLRSIRYRKSLKLWADLLLVLSQSDADAMEKSSRLWPVALRRRYASAFFIMSENVGPTPRFDCWAVRDLSAMSVLNSGDLSAARQLSNQYSWI
jgi:hypothetical protein